MFVGVWVIFSQCDFICTPPHRVSLYTHIHTCVCELLCVCVCVCMYVYIYIWIYNIYVCLPRTREKTQHSTPQYLENPVWAHLESSTAESSVQMTQHPVFQHVCPTVPWPVALEACEGWAHTAPPYTGPCAQENRKVRCRDSMISYRTHNFLCTKNPTLVEYKSTLTCA